MNNKYVTNFLVRVSQPAHTTGDAKHVVVDSVNADLGSLINTNGVVGEGQAEGGVINTGHVTRARRLVVLGVEGEGVHVNTNGGDVGVVLERLH